MRTSVSNSGSEWKISLATCSPSNNRPWRDEVHLCSAKTQQTSIEYMLPWAHGHQRKALRDFVQAIIDQQTGCQAQLARSFGNQEAAAKRLSRLLHNERLEPRLLADAVLLQALVQLPAHGPVRLAIDWPIEGHQHLLVVSLIVGRRAVP